MISLHPFLKWIAISILIGIVAGWSATVFSFAIHLANETFLAELVGYHPPVPAGEGSPDIMPYWSATRPWLLPLITTLGGLLSGILVHTLAPEARGGGQDAAIESFHHARPIRTRLPFVKLLTSAIVIGAGGSAGREGPIAHIGAGIGSNIGRLLRLNTRERQIAMVMGMGAGIGAIFHAPLGGAILAIEILYTDDMEGVAILPVLLASTVGYGFYGIWSGWHPIFTVTSTEMSISSPLQLLYFAILGIICGRAGLLYIASFEKISLWFRLLRVPAWLKPALGGLIVGLVGLLIPHVIGLGYGWLQISLDKELLNLPLWVVLLLPFAKILMTSCSIGSGGSGGIFGPGLVAGGMLGALLWRVGYFTLPGLPDSPAPFVIVGMMALQGSIAHAPIAVTILVAEMTASFSLLTPAIVTVSLACFIVGKRTLYTHQRTTRSLL